MHKVEILENKNVKITISGGCFSSSKFKTVVDNAILLNIDVFFGKYLWTHKIQNREWLSPQTKCLCFPMK